MNGKFDEAISNIENMFSIGGGQNGIEVLIAACVQSNPERIYQ